MKIYLIFVFTAVICMADWSRVDEIYYNTNSIVNYQEYIYTALYGYLSGNSAVNGDRLGVGAGQLNNLLYLRINDIANGTESKYERNHEGNINRIVEIDPFSDANKTFFDVSQYAQSNEAYYGNNITSYFSDNAQINVDQNIPDKTFLESPQYGDVFNKFSSKVWAEGFGIDAIKNSAQTAEIRADVNEVETKVKGMIGNDYTQSVLNYDFSEIGNYFVRSNSMILNPFANLKGHLRIKPDVGDLHYEIWHRYFDRSSSNYAIVLKYCIHTIMFIAFTIYVLNDLMSIVDA